MTRPLLPLIKHAERVARDVLALTERMKTMERLGASKLLELANVAAPDAPCEHVASDDPLGPGGALGSAAMHSSIASGSTWTLSNATESDAGGDDSGSTDGRSSRGTSKAALPGDVRERSCVNCSATKTSQWREGPRWVCNRCYAARRRAGAPDRRSADALSAKPNTRASTKRKAAARDRRSADALSAKPNTRASTKRKSAARDRRSADALSAKPNTRASTKCKRTDADGPLSERRALAPDEYIVDDIGGCNDDGMYDVSWKDSLVDESELYAVRKYRQSQIEEIVLHPGPTRKYVVRWLNTWEPEEHLLGNEIYEAMTRVCKSAT
jgi:hypothetical protein